MTKDLSTRLLGGLNKSIFDLGLGSKPLGGPYQGLTTYE